MKRFLSLLVFLAALAGSASCLAPPAAKVLYRITGTAVSARDGAPVPYCRMQISESAQVSPSQPEPRRQRQQPAEIDADARGHFQITVDHPGHYVLTGSAREYRRQNFDAHEGFFSSIVLTSASPTADVTFRMQRDASLTGLVLDEAAEAVRNAQVVAESVEDQGTFAARSPRFGRAGGIRQAGFAQTDDRGRYEISGLAPGSYRLRVTARPWYAQTPRPGRNTTATSLDPSLDVVYPVTWFPGAAEEDRAETLKLNSGEERQADVTLVPTAAVHLVVPRPDPGPAADGQVRPQRGAFLTRVSPDADGFPQLSMMTGTNQDFGALSPGTYELHNTGPDGRPLPGATQFRVLPGSSGIVDLSRAVTLTKVTLKFDGVDAAEAGAPTFVDPITHRSISPDSGFGGGRRRREQEGDREQAVYLAPGAWQVHLPAFANTYIKSLEAKGATVQGLTLTVGDEPATLTLHLGTGRGEVAGVALQGTRPVEGAMVLLVPATLGDPAGITEVLRDQTNTDGSFLLRAVVPGAYILVAIDHGWSVNWRDLPTLTPYLVKGVPLDVKSGSKLEEKLQSVEP